MMKYAISTAMVLAATGNASAQLCGALTPQGQFACQQQQILNNQRQILHNQMMQGGAGVGQIQPLNLNPGQLVVPQMKFGR